MTNRPHPPRPRPATPILRIDYHRTPNDVAITRLLKRHPQLARLRKSHPALLVALCQETYGAAATDRAIAQLRHGAPVDSVMRSLRLPVWLNDYTEAQLLADFTGLPTSNAFGAAITAAPFKPISADKTSELLFAIRVAHRCGGERAATILLPFLLVEPRVLDPRLLVIVATFIAVLDAPTCPAHRFIVAPPDCSSLQALMRAAVSWLTLLLMAVQYGPEGAPRWRDVSECRGHEMTWVRSADDLVRLARGNSGMRADAGFHAPSYILDVARIVSITRGGCEIGHVELRVGGRHRDALQVYRIDARDGGSLQPAARRAVHAMLGEDPPAGHTGEPDPAAPHLDAERLQLNWVQLMGPLLIQHAASVMFPPVLTPDAFVVLLEQVYKLSVQAGLGKLIAEPMHAFETRFV